jgi:hypothetical protein
LGVFGGAAAFTLLVPAAAGAATVGPYGGGSTVVTDPAPAASGTASATAGNAADASLPFTGGDVAGLVAIGAGTVAAGAIATRVRRHRQPA